MSSFTPQVRDTTLGPNVHTYIPRADGAIVINGIAYFPDGPKPVVPATLPIPVTTSNVSQPAPVVGYAGNAMPTQPIQTAPLPVPQPAYIPPPQFYPQAPTYAYPPYPYAPPQWAHPGATPSEVLTQNIMHTETSAKQEMKPADDDPHRFYMVRELDGSWSRRNRMTIDSGDIGECRWFAREGEFYAVRLASS
ncbi:hypothetical protein GLAREA_09847 [Glarea lozoyensis ATCC 20868]|uniref:Uncharacterized protein n=1 Tax=Glarea lozoyensis (strain ATCC 20868 / MF5171) TaxID=1116229 RepID=S3D9S2_GLAL2|nr:uncharacterized protein GLAREA_09847 [Glarea lozoyensis ATCC 20868]EPE28726.1 hypothetical protein GLAREA_09847 [Glarea lozoyensis ATCC 20868]